MIPSNRLVWNILLSSFTLSIIAERLDQLSSSSNIDLTSTTPIEANDRPRRTQQDPTARDDGSSTTKDMSKEDVISSHDDVTVHGLSSITHAVHTSSVTVDRDTVASVHSSKTELPGTNMEIDESNKVATTSMLIAVGDSRNNTSRFSDIPISTFEVYGPTAHNYRQDTGRSTLSLLGNNSMEPEQELNTTNGSVLVAEPTIVSVLPPLDVYWQQRLSIQLLTYISPFLIIIGTIGNAVSLITLQNRLFRFSSTGLILSALSLVDIAVLNTGLMRHWLLKAFGINIRDLTRAGCKLHFLLTYYLHQLASWTLILLTVERTIALWFPLRCKELCSRRRVVIAWFTIAILLFAEHTFFFPAFDLRPSIVDSTNSNTTFVEYTCNIRGDWYEFFDLDWSYIDACVGDFFPFLVVLIGNILTVVRIVKSRRERERQMGVASNPNSRVMASTTAMLIGVSVLFLVLSLPIDILFLYYAYRGSVLPQNEEQAIYNLAYALVTLSYYANNALDFIMYFVSGRKFRQAFLETFLPCRKTTKQNVQTLTQRRYRSQESNQTIGHQNSLSISNSS